METGQTIAGKYRLNHLLGQGGMASVWSATNVFTERQFAIKFMLPQMARTPEAARRFLLEAKASARINHPNIIEIIDVGQTEDGAPFLVMELLSGMSLETAMRRQKPPMTVYEFAVVMLDVARAMAAAHRSGVIHRDLKPTNIYLHKDRHGIAIPKVLDFGVSKFLDEERSANRGLTVEGTVLGSPMYMSPEQARGANIDGRTDIFSFGSILFEGMAGFRCYDAPNFNALLVKVATTVPLDVEECAPEMPESLRRLAAACLVVDRQHRLSTFEEVTDQLGLAIPDLEGTTQRLRLHRETIEAESAPSEAQLTEARPGGYRLSEAIPPGVSSPWTPNGDQRRPASMAPPAPEQSSRAVRAFAGAGIAGLVGVLILAAYARGGARPETDLVPSANRPPGVGAATVAGDAGEGSVVTLDALPVVSNQHPQGPPPQAPPPHGTGHLFVTASPGWCTLYVDGAAKGPTPLGLDLPAGGHFLRCDPSTGKSKSASVILTDGATTQKKFSL